jgi:hypothetical protein
MLSILGNHRKKRIPEASPALLAALPDEALLEELQRQIFHFFWVRWNFSWTGISRRRQIDLQLAPQRIKDGRCFA